MKNLSKIALVIILPLILFFILRARNQNNEAALQNQNLIVLLQSKANQKQITEFSKRNGLPFQIENLSPKRQVSIRVVGIRNGVNYKEDMGYEILFDDKGRLLSYKSRKLKSSKIDF